MRTFKEQMAADAAAFINVNEFADSVYYNGATAAIAAVVELGQDVGKGNTFTGQGSAARAIIHVAATAVSSPSVRDYYLHNSKTWRHARILRSDGIIHEIECVADESAWP